MNQSFDDHTGKIISLLEEAYACRVNNLGHSMELAEEALSISKRINDKTLIGKSLSQLSLFKMIRGEYDISVSMATEAITLFTELQDEKGIADAKYNIAGAYYKTDNYHLGLINLIDCLVTYKKLRDFHNQARVQKSLGTIYEYFGDQKNAVKSYHQSIVAAINAGDINLESNAYNPLSGIYLKQNKIEKALEIIEKSIIMKKQTGDIRGLAFALYGRGKVFIKTKQFSKAEDDLKEAISIHKDMGERLGLGMAYYKMAVLYAEMDKIKEAKESLYLGLEFSNKYNIVLVKVKCNNLLYLIFKKENNHVKALEYLEEYLLQKEAVINTQTLKVIENYELITKMESLEKESQLQKEKAEIIEKKNLAEQAAKVKQDFLSTMSHEIRTPLNAVITIASLLTEKSNPEDKQLLDSLKFAGNNLLMIINDILDFTKLDSNKVRLEYRPCDFTLLLENVKNTYVGLAKEKSLDLLLTIDSSIATAYEIDETKLSQILGNLITNAIKFTDTGSINVKVEKISSEGFTDKLRFAVSDTGIGISPDFLDEIFDSFSQPQSITTRKQGGSGLGLAIVKKLVALHGSTVHVKSILDKGSVFYFDLNLKRAVGPKNIPANNSEQLRGKTVLLAEDYAVNAIVAIKLLSKWGITTEHAKNGLEAVEKAKAKAFDFIIMDIHMPEMDGFQATQYIRKEENPNKNTPIFVLTADITAEEKEEYSQYFTGYLWKPIQVNKLYDALMAVV